MQTLMSKPQVAISVPRKRTQRVVSVDMGIRNLAFCAIEVPAGFEKPIEVCSWTRMDLVDREVSLSQSETSIQGEPIVGAAADMPPDRRKAKAKAKRVPVDPTAFGPAVLSNTAYAITQKLLEFRPDTILIERQRFRSGGAAAIQEWTVRVNMLESMIWACLATLRAQQEASTGSNHPHPSNKSFPLVKAVDPARVARFWVPGAAVPLRPPSDLFTRATALFSDKATSSTGRKKIEKRDKVQVVQAWARNEEQATELYAPLEFVGSAASVAAAFQSGVTARQATELAGGKLDDLADCLLQAVAWVQWEENRQRIEEQWKRAEVAIVSENESTAAVPIKARTRTRPAA